ncbi:sigma 54-interacting transcriptional regulator [Pseudomonas sp. P66]|uniref:Sigma 54-interacting transcriptional regulator n=1 Tax=Pseudomonas arcuscaelestis TaxID=2710591 RepID=A0ABS2BZI8_9PSED|nr:RNA repair transcriptional activator RtcR [Pseudomonas arcuscaelestis]MBM5459046.1 sigma 54-interacting transcriptional regulator [Pseudomonas arcuscaelestis]
MNDKKTVAIGILGSKLDRVGKGEQRWNKWRPTISLCQQPDLMIDRLELIHGDGRWDTDLALKVKEDIAQVSPETEVCLHSMKMTNAWDFEEVYASLHDFAAGYPFDPDNENYLTHITTGTHVQQIVWFLLAESRHVPAKLVQTQPSGFRDDEPSPAGKHVVTDLDLERYDQIAKRFQAERLQGTELLKSGIATRNAAFNRTIDQIERVSVRSNAPILICGPTGAGKSFLARRIFELKRGRHQLDGTFVEVNCATLRGDSAMSTLFGHTRGAFTGAQQAREGLLRSAHKGTLFLDEIGELPLDEQAMLLKAIEEKKFLPMGSDKEVESDFILIAGTNKDLRAQVAQGLFREDLLARINTWTFELPGLAQRTEDIEPNIDYELQRHAKEQGHMVRFNAKARRRYLEFATAKDAAWTGNFRELSASITRMGTLADGGRIDLDLVEGEMNRLNRDWNVQSSQDRLSQHLEQVGLEIDLFDRLQLEAVLKVCCTAASQAEAGRKLFFHTRLAKSSANDSDRIRKFLARFQISWSEIQSLIPRQ